MQNGSPLSMPEFTQTGADAWINSVPLNVGDLRGKVVLLDFWTFDCWNCYRSFPWLKSLEARYQGDAFQVIGIHTPEFDHEKVAGSVNEKVRKFGLEHPIMLDNDYGYWRRMNNRYWPAYYLIDKKGLVRGYFYGETHIGDRRAKKIEEQLQTLLAE
jgi:thiol-disulfide isomerase/thioredoxin